MVVLLNHLRVRVLKMQYRLRLKIGWSNKDYSITANLRKQRKIGSSQQICGSNEDWIITTKSQKGSSKVKKVSKQGLQSILGLRSEN
jgi:hypothetical protein